MSNATGFVRSGVAPQRFCWQRPRGFVLRVTGGGPRDFMALAVRRASRGGMDPVVVAQRTPRYV
jgi:hypothetical protein